MADIVLLDKRTAENPFYIQFHDNMNNNGPALTILHRCAANKVVHSEDPWEGFLLSGQGLIDVIDGAAYRLGLREG